MSDDMMIREHLRSVRAEIAAARTRRTHVPPDAPVELIAVTKNHPVEAMRTAIDDGVMNIGENRIQEALDKAENLEREVKWHLIGHLQTNKAKHAVRQFDLIHSVDSMRLAREIDRAAEKFGKVQNILVQVNLAREVSKSGIYREDLGALLTDVDRLPHVRLQGFMCIAPNYDDVERCRPLFRDMYELFQEAKETEPTKADIRYLSMGMTHDYAIAVEEGANLVRVGTGIFGARQYQTVGV
ncbi:YggS family pyridoxal phosphate-dependent enzyme [Selenomonas sp. F0473]|uniref:YggS family pyridoxal phosphate-dependent enzyme n=1 Tax=Selenomonas sp. F0473 TaxID=999423 RepID=UPI0025E59E2E|nr:YggS family pyridoxal phosphate-dependent enzyme [Selenomonas sp. F0473]